MSMDNKKVGEEEVAADVGGWVASIILWVFVLARSIASVQHLCKGMVRCSDARIILEGLGFGNSFVNQLTMRFLSCLGFCQGPILMMGTGTHLVGNLLCGTDAIDVDKCYEHYLALLPMLNYLVAATLGSQWLVALLCEARKNLKKEHARRTPSAEKEEHYQMHLTKLLTAFGVQRTDGPRGLDVCPRLKLPSWASRRDVGRVLDLFSALLLRFAEDVLGRTEVPTVGPGGTALRRSAACQWQFMLDRRSLVNFNTSLVPCMQKHLAFEASFGWVHHYVWTNMFTTSLWKDVLVQMALGHTLLAESMVHSAMGHIDER
jgi:hypothetical protein